MVRYYIIESALQSIDFSLHSSTDCRSLAITMLFQYPGHPLSISLFECVCVVCVLVWTNADSQLCLWAVRFMQYWLGKYSMGVAILAAQQIHTYTLADSPFAFRHSSHTLLTHSGIIHTPSWKSNHHISLVFEKQTQLTVDKRGLIL